MRSKATLKTYFEDEKQLYIDLLGYLKEDIEYTIKKISNNDFDIVNILATKNIGDMSEMLGDLKLLAEILGED